VGEQGAVVRLPDDDLLVGAAGDLDGLLARLERLDLAVDQVAVAGDLLQVEGGDVDAGVGQPPGDVPVVPDYHSWHAREGVTGHVVLALRGDAAAVQAHLVPDGRQRGRQVRVVGEQRLAGDGVLAGDHPGVGADAVAVDTDGGRQVLHDLLEAGELALQRGPAGAGSRTGAGARPGARAGPCSRGGPCSRSVAGAGAARAAALLVRLGQLVVLPLPDDRLVAAVRVGRVLVGDLLWTSATGHQDRVCLVLLFLD